MRRLAITVVLFASVALVGATHAGSRPQGTQPLLDLTRANIIVPVEWDGTWNTIDSSYTCVGALQSTSAGVDTLCGGKDYSPGSAITYTCSGTADATTLNLTCSGSQVVFTDCTATYTTVINGTRTNDTFHIVSTTNITYTGSGFGCSLLPPQCSQFDSWGTRTGPAPTGYCSTPVKQASWGRLKVMYR